MAERDTSNFDTNPDYGQLTFWERLSVKFLPLYLYGITVPKVILRRQVGIGPTHLPLSLDLRLDSMRTSTALLSSRQIRSFHGSGDAAAAKVLSVPRFAGVKQHLYQPVRRANMLGYWIVRNSLSEPTSPTESELVLYYLHGGAYCIYQPGHFLVFQLRLAEALLLRGVKVSIFALDYTLAPEAAFPAQLEQAARGYQYLVEELGIEPAKIAIMGDSAGANLSLSLLTHLASPHPSIIPNPTTRLAKPSLAILISPWVSLHAMRSSYTSNALVDFIPPAGLESFASSFRGTTPATDATLQKYTEFVHTSHDLSSVLPQRTHVLAGGAELFLPDITAFVEKARQAGAEIDLNVLERRMHDPPVTECVRGPGVQKYRVLPLKKEAGREMLPVTAGLAEDIAVCVKRRGMGMSRL